MKQHLIKQDKLKEEEKIAWTKILKNWIQVHKIYYQQSGNDKAYIYNERASISLLAASIWKSGGIAIEEYKAKKIRNEETKNGRVDLWFSLDGYSAVVEAKHLRRSVNDFFNKKNAPESPNNKINQFIKMALKDAKNSGEVDGEAAYAVVFLYLDNNKNQEIAIKNIFQQIEKLNCDFFACVNCGELTDKYPAGIILGKKYLRKSVKKK